MPASRGLELRRLFDCAAGGRADERLSNSGFSNPAGRRARVMHTWPPRARRR